MRGIVFAQMKKLLCENIFDTSDSFSWRHCCVAITLSAVYMASAAIISQVHN